MIGTLTLVRTIMGLDLLAYRQDLLAGLKVVPNDYMVPDITVEHVWHDFGGDIVEVPFAVQLLCTEDGWPEWEVWSFHRSREGAELAAAQLEARHGLDPWDVRVQSDWTGYRFELAHRPLQN